MQRFLIILCSFPRLALAIALLVTSAPPVPAMETNDAGAIQLTQWLAQPTLTLSDTTIDMTPLRPVYATDTHLLWVDDAGLTTQASRALAVIAAADTQGINPELYNLHAIQAIAAMVPQDATEVMQHRVSLELLVSTAILRYTTDMHSGIARHQWDTGADSLTAETRAGFIRSAALAPDTANYLAAMAPNSTQYSQLMKAYMQYAAIAKNGGWPAFTPGKAIKPGMQDERVPVLRQILAVNGDMLALPANATTEYDAATVAGVKMFQARHGIEAGGVIDAATQAAIGISAQKRVEQIALTMERMRWMPRDLGSRYVLVNLPSYGLTAVANGRELNMHVIVGKTATPTPMFSKEITDITFNPSWSVPAKIAANEMLPKIRKNPNYLAHAGFTLVSNGETVDPSNIDWSNVSKSQFNYTIRQNPGDDNALGKVKFTIPDSDNIYLHDTSNRSMFDRTDRDLSHGCVRLGDPRALTRFVLNSEGWSEAKIDAAYDASASRTVRITPLPVHLVYWTSWVDNQGLTHFAPDIYGKDKSLLAEMSAPIKRSENVKVALN